MGKSTIIMLTLAALVLGTLIGISLIGSEPVRTPAASVARTPESMGNAPVIRYLDPDEIAAVSDEFGRPAPSTVGENFLPRDKVWKSDVITIEIPMDGAVEHKALMAQGDTMVFNWRTDGGQVYFDFHAHDKAFGDKFFTRYEEGETDSRSGAVIAAYDGQHGWYWLNLEPEAITITLEVAGFYDKVIKIDLGSG